MTERLIPVFDGHNDTVLDLRDGKRTFFEESAEGHIDLPRAKRGGLAGGFFAVFIRDPQVEISPTAAGVGPYGDLSTLPPMMSTEYAQSVALANLGELIRVAKQSNGEVRVCTTAAEIRQCIADGKLAMELHFEGAEPIDTDFTALDSFYAAGLRSIGPVWSRSNLFGHGVPFAFPSSPDTGPGLTDAGFELVRNCNKLGIMLDVSHLNEKGFWDLAKTTDAPIVGTHTGAHALTPSARNLTDKQIDAVGESKGIIGINFHIGFLRPDGKADPETAAATDVTVIADHLDYIANRIGIDCVALGSDFDGAVMPGGLKDCAGLPRLMAELRRRGYDDAALTKIGTENWLRVFEATWGE